MDTPTANAWLVFLAAATLVVSGLGAWFAYQQLQLAREAAA